MIEWNLDGLGHGWSNWKVAHSKKALQTCTTPRQCRPTIRWVSRTSSGFLGKNQQITGELPCSQTIVRLLNIKMLVKASLSNQIVGKFVWELNLLQKIPSKRIAIKMNLLYEFRLFWKKPQSERKTQSSAWALVQGTTATKCQCTGLQSWQGIGLCRSFRILSTRFGLHGRWDLSECEIRDAANSTKH